MAKEKEKKSIKDSVKGEAKTFFAELKKFGREAGELAQRGSKEISRVSQLGKLRGEIVLLIQKRGLKIKKLGEAVMQSKKSAIKDPEALKVTEEIRAIDEKKKTVQEQIDRLRKKIGS